MRILPGKTRDQIEPPALSFPQDDESQEFGFGAVVIDRAGLAPARRLVVLVPPVDVDEAELARRVRQLAAPAGLAVLFLGLCAQAAQEPAMRRRLIPLAGLTRDDCIWVDTHLESGGSPSRRIGATYRPGDVILCPAETGLGLGRRPLGQLAQSMGMPVWTLRGLYTSEGRARLGPLAGPLFWVMSILLLAGFFRLQTGIVHLQVDWARNLLLYLSILAEAGLLAAWHHISV